ncbi:Structural maintenance of chromosomes protein 3 [Coemansia javaensis]|uniref:Chloride channel protein n=1 Tax=Coemansia javaensis TaxID=2761396 RepID=A0A9W8HET0_9FUNG|nr:Structural maintenance of chromosomes protein 3 [Coemansia javaensis]
MAGADSDNAHPLVPLQRQRPSEEALIGQQSPGGPPAQELDMITGWLYNGPLQRAEYGDFSTIDWIYDNTKERHHRRDRRARARSAGTLGRLELAADAAKPWLVLLAVGATMGLIATCVSVSSQWLIDSKSGYCRTGFYLNRRFCCWNADSVCLDWVTWSELLHVRWRWLDWLLQYMVFIFDANLFAAISTFLVTEYAPYAAGQGIAEIKTIMSGFTMRRFLGLRTLGIKCVGVVLSVASGLSLGKEGTMVHIACCCGNVYARAFRGIRRSEVKRREVLSAAASAGISVAFGAPIAGVLFSLEQVSYYFPAKTMWRSLFCATVAAVTLKLLNPFRNGKLVPFQVTYDRTWDLFELWFYVLIGVVCGVAGMLQNRLALFLMEYRQRSALKNLARGEVVVVAVVTAIVSFPSVFLRADMVTLVSNLFTECTDQDSGGLCSRGDRAGNVAALLLTSAARVLLTSVACGLAVPAGMFTPSMATGASIGRAVGMVVQTLYERHPAWRLFAACRPDVPCITPGVYALVGAASMLASTTRMTVTVVVIMFELTDAVIYVLPIMLAVTVSKSVADAFGKDGYFEGIISLHGYPFLSKDQEYVLRGTSDGLMVRASEMAVLSAHGETLRSVAALLDACTYSGFPIVRSKETMALAGYISRSDLAMAARRVAASSLHSPDSPCCFTRGDSAVADHAAVDFRPWVDAAPITISHGTDLNLVAETFRQLGVRYALVTHHATLLGIITKKDIVRAVRMQARNSSRRLALPGPLSCDLDAFWLSMLPHTTQRPQRHAAISIQGFKSYKDETTTDPLSPHHNVVVGRNGSGKSNFFAAARFVLSDAYTSLTREERQALLHEGAGPSTMSAYVEVVFDNADGRFPTGKDETVVRRTIGLKKDDYSLDRKSSTKAEIHSLLESAGFSRSNPYYIVPQGRVTSLTHAKDSERLALLKEVAGTRVYESRRESSIKIIEETERTRAKIAEDLALIEERLSELDTEKEELDKYRALDRERRCMEYAIYSLEQEDVAEQLDEIEVRREQLMAAVNARQEARGDLEQQAAGLEAEIRAAKQALEILTIDREQLASEAEDLARTRAQVESAIQDLEQDRALGRDGITELRRSVDSLGRDIRKREAELARAAAEYDRAFAAETGLREQFEVADQQRKSLLQKQGRSGNFDSKKERDAWLRSEIARLEDAVQQQRAQHDATERERAELSSRLDAIAQSIADATAREEAAAAQISEMQAREAELKEARDIKISERKELWRKEARLEAGNSDLRDELKRAERALSGTVDRATSEGLQALPEIQERLGLTGVHGPLFELFEVDETYRTCVETIAGASLFHVVVDTDETATQVLDELGRRKLGRLTFMPLNRLHPPAATYPNASDAIPMIDRLRFDRRYLRAFQQVFGRTIICPSLDVGSGYARSMNLTAVTLEGDKVDRRGELTGGFVSRKGSRLEAARTLAQVRARMQAASHQASETLAALAVLDQEITAQHSELQGLSARMAQAGSERFGARQERRRLTKEEGDARQFCDGAAKSLAVMRTQQAAAELELQALQDELAAPFSRGLSAEERVQLERLTAAVDGQAGELARLSAARAEAEGRRNTLQSELGLGLRMELEDAQRQLEVAMAENPDKAIGVHSRELAKIAQLQDGASERLAEVHREIEDKTREIGDMDRQLGDVRTALDNEGRRVHKEMEQLEKCLAQRSLYQQKKSEYTRNIQDLGVLPEEAFRNFGRTQLPKLAKKLHRVNEKLKQFGHVNKKAFEQYSVFARQRESIRQRKQELDQSAASIEELIQVLDQRKDEAIERTFKQVSKYFSETFAKLVPAGRGVLVMQRRVDQAAGGGDDDDGDDDDVAMGGNAQGSVDNYIGVSIRVSFNSTSDEGLRMQQLSGGQKSLVALTLIFAIQRCDPAPFYLFDEIDANLDAVYRTAVADMIHELSRNSQFVTTTFRPEMLAHADKFYGVTFENKVSRITTITREAAVSFIEESQPA